jgi:dTDP-glucose pyrophosphorylase
MKVAILAGGLGTRLSEETTIKPKPMLWQSMDTVRDVQLREKLWQEGSALWKL